MVEADRERAILENVTSPSLPVPQRIGDAERDQAVEYLREHLAVGRIDQTEFDERLDVALTARYGSDLDPLFTDLPAPKPGLPLVPVVPQPQPTHVVVPRPQAPGPAIRNTAQVALGTLAMMAWPLAIVAMVTLPGSMLGHLWFLIFVPIMLTGMFGRSRGGRRR